MPNHSRASIAVATAMGAALILGGMTAHSCAASVDITLFKARHAVQGFGNLFYAGDRYRLLIEGVAADSLQSPRTILTGSVENIHAPSDILGTYEPVEPGGNTIVDNGKPLRIKNRNGVILDMRGINLGKKLPDIAGLTVTSRGWGPDAKERARH